MITIALPMLIKQINEMLSQKNNDKTTSKQRFQKYSKKFLPDDHRPSFSQSTPFHIFLKNLSLILPKKNILPDDHRPSFSYDPTYLQSAPFNN